MVGAAGAVGRGGAAELCGDDDKRFRPVRAEPGLEGAEHRVQPAQLLAEPAALAGMGVPAARLDHRDPRALRP